MVLGYPLSNNPLTLTIEIESEADLIDLWHRMNFNHHPNYDGYDFAYNEAKGKFLVWCAINKAAVEAGLKPFLRP